MLQDDCTSELHQLLNTSFASSASFEKWLRSDNTVCVAQFCLILNLEAAHRALPIAEADIHSNIATFNKATFSAAFLQNAHKGQEIANSALKILRYAHASMQKCLMLAKTYPTLSQNVVLSLRKLSCCVSICIVFWMSHKIYDPIQIKLFVSEMMNLKTHYPDIFQVDNLASPAIEATAFAKLLQRSYDMIGASYENETRSTHSGDVAINEHRIPQKISSSQKDSDSLSQMSQKHHHFSFHLPHISIPRIEMPHVGMPNIVHVVSALDVRHYAHWHVQVPHFFHRASTPSLSTHGYTVDEIFERAELALHFIAVWATHRAQSPMTADILKKLSKAQTDYIKAIAFSIDEAQFMNVAASKAMELVSGLSKESDRHDLNVYQGDMEKIIPHLDRPENCETHFRHVRQAVIQDHSECSEKCTELKSVMRERIFELERTNEILELFGHNIDLFIEWWTRLKMGLTDLKDPDMQAKIVLECPMARQSLLGRWENLQLSLVHYTAKMSELKDLFPALFDEARRHVDSVDLN